MKFVHCKNYASPLHTKSCKAGITFQALREEHGSFLKWPCTQGHAATCDKAEWPTPEELAAERAAMRNKVDMVMAGIKAAQDFRKANKGRNNQGVVKCPESGGNLHLTIAACNGHVHGKCETPDCIEWME